MWTVAPSRARRSAVAAPIPELAPVTSTDQPSSEPSSASSQDRLRTA